MSVKQIANRIMMEKTIVRRVVRDAIAAGYALSINNGGETDEIVCSHIAGDVLCMMFAADDEHLIFSRDGKRVGWVYFVYGNDGYDVISDYSVNLEEVLRGANALADRLGGFGG